MLTDAPLGLLIMDSARLLRARFDEELDRAQLGLTAGEARAFVYISRYEASRQATLAALMGVEPMTLVGFLDRLESAGLVAREPDPTDRRAKIVRLTPKAEPLVERVVTALRGVVETVLQEFRPDEVERLRSMLTRLRARLAVDEWEACR